MSRMLRPKVQVLPDSAMAPAATHTIAREQPYYLTKPAKASEPAGTLPAGSEVRLVSKGRGPMCLVDDAKGQRVYTPSSGLCPIE